MDWRREAPSQLGHVLMAGVPTFFGHWYYGAAIALLREHAQHGTWGLFEKLAYPEDYEDLLWGYLPGFALGYVARWVWWLLCTPWWW